jgi:hypothetical protein
LMNSKGFCRTMFYTMQDLTCIYKLKMLHHGRIEQTGQRRNLMT